MPKAAKTVEVETINKINEVREVLQIVKEIAEDERLSPEERARRRAEKLKAGAMLSDREAERILRDKKASDQDIQRVYYKYQKDAQSIFMNKNRVIHDPAPNSRPHRSRAQMRRAYAMASAQAATPGEAQE